MKIALSDSVVLPLHIELSSDSLFLLNAEERLGSRYERRRDSIFCKLAGFDSWLQLKAIDDTVLEGRWYNYQKGSDYFLPVSAVYSGNRENRFEATDSAVDFSGRYEVSFLDNGACCSENKAIGVLAQQGNIITGTFLTETGDYRYLEGSASGNRFMLSAFDGSHAYLFSAELRGDSLFGQFYSGNHYTEGWVARRNDSFELRDPYSLTYLKKGYSDISFSFPNAKESGALSFPGEKYKNKVVVIQLLGSWCPNCMDESRFYKVLYEQYNKDGLEIIGVGFEIPDDLEKKKARIQDFISFTGAEYDFVVGGKANKISAGEAFPQLNHVLSFPTSIFIDRQGVVRKIHTGFSGPGTGIAYIKLTEEITRFVEQLLNEGNP